MLKRAIVSLAIAAAALPAMAQQEGKWMVRVRAVNLDMANKSDAGNGNLGVTAAVLPADAIRVSDKLIPEVDISYFITKNIAAELILTYPQKHDVTITSGALAEPVGSFKHLPPTLTLQYHFLPDGQFRPYVGAGLNYTRVSGVSLRSNRGGVDLQLDSSSWGPALQAGFDVKLSRNMFLNVDLKKIYIESDVKANGTKISHVKLDPLAFGVGIGWRF
ncbi:MAG: OmpW family protein [Burkholderiales bacterium]|nr:OmpW family protein [Burkholderiales bacterium]